VFASQFDLSRAEQCSGEENKTAQIEIRQSFVAVLQVAFCIRLQRKRNCFDPLDFMQTVLTFVCCSLISCPFFASYLCAAAKKSEEISKVKRTKNRQTDAHLKGFKTPREFDKGER